jgi:ParB family chromosome partitioning protein
MDMIDIRTELIDEDIDQPRYQFGEESLQELMQSIEELGLLSPIKVRTTKDGRYKIIYGNRRYKACKTLGLQTIPCIVSNVTDELEIYLEQIAENLTREGFSPIEEAEAFNKLLNDPRFSSSTKYLSSKLGKPESYIKNKCDLLKFGNPIKKLIVSGTDIRKDKLTEEQLLPIKELPIEHRDPLALIIARDELPVSDVKKIARLFKEKDISSGTKDKLLYKSGRELLETWFTYEQNKAERAKPAEPKPAKIEKPEKAKARLEPTVTATEPLKVTPIEDKLQCLLASLPSYNPLPSEIIHSYEAIKAKDKENFISGVDSVIEHLEKHLAEWKKIKDLTAAPAKLEP